MMVDQLMMPNDIHPAGAEGQLSTVEGG